MDRDDLSEHLRFARELGVRGTSRDATWRVRGGETAMRDETSAVEPVAAEPARDDLRTGDASVTASAPGPSPSPGSASVVLATLRDEIGPACTRCKLHTMGRRQVVFGVGNPDAALMFVGEAPGADEDEQGVPFVGRAGQLLTKIIEAIDLRRDEVYIANVIKCRPPSNRNPEPDEIAQCEPFLLAQITAVRPAVIVTLGTFATQVLLRTDESISKLRGRTHEYRGAVVIPTFHPAYLLRNPSAKRDVWEDMKRVRDLLRAE